MATRARRFAGRALRRVEREIGHEVVPRNLLRRLAPSAPAPTRPSATDTDTLTPPSETVRTVHPEAVWSGAPRTPLRAVVLADDRLAELLAPEWHQVRPDAGATSLEGVDLVFVQLADGVRSAGDADRLVASAADAGVPVIAWAIAPVQPPTWLDRCTAVFSSDAAAAATLSAAGAAVTRIAPFVQPLTQGPAGHDETSTRRGRQIGVVVDDGASFSPEQLTQILAPALTKMPRREMTMIATHERPGSLRLPADFPDRIQAVGPWSAVGGTLGSVAAALDLSGSTPGAAWSSMAAAMHTTPMVGLDGLGQGLPEDVSTLIPRAASAFDLRVDLGARMRQRELARREGHLLMRAAMRGHTAGHRVQTIAVAAGLPLPALDRSVSAVVPTNRTHELANVLANIGRQEDVDVELVLVLHGLTLDEAELRTRAIAAGVDNLVIVNADAELTLGACMNLGVDASSGRYVAKMDDDNYYGPQFLADLVDSFAYSGAGITGKWCHYVWLTSSRAVVLRYPDHEHRFGNRVQGGSMLFEGEVVRSLRFSDIPRQVDSDILDRAHAQGIGIYSADPWNYVSIRAADRHAHTWTVTDGVFFTDTGDVRFFGDPTEHVTL